MDYISCPYVTEVAQRLKSVEDITPIIKFLCTDGAWMNGECLSLLMPSALANKRKQARRCLRMVATLRARSGRCFPVWSALERSLIVSMVTRLLVTDLGRWQPSHEAVEPPIYGRCSTPVHGLSSGMTRLGRAPGE